MATHIIVLYLMTAIIFSFITITFVKTFPLFRRDRANNPAPHSIWDAPVWMVMGILISGIGLAFLYTHSVLTKDGMLYGYIFAVALLSGMRFGFHIRQMHLGPVIQVSPCEPHGCNDMLCRHMNKLPFIATLLLLCLIWALASLPSDTYIPVY